MLIVLLSFSSSLATRDLSLNDEPSMFRPNLINLNLVDIKYYQFMVRLDKCSGSCNSDNDFYKSMCSKLKLRMELKIKTIN